MKHLNIVLNQDEMEIINKIKKMYGITSIVQAFRFALNCTAKYIDAPVNDGNVTNDNSDIIISLQRQNEKLQDDLSKSIENERKLYNMLYNMPSTAPAEKTQNNTVSQADTKPVKAADAPKAPTTATVADMPVAEKPVAPVPAPIIQTRPEPVVTDNMQSAPKKYDPIEHYKGNSVIEALLADADDGSEW